MKLKQRVVVTGVLFLGMSAFFLIGILFASSRENADKTAAAGKNPPAVQPPVREKSDAELQEERLERNRRLQQKLDLGTKEEAEKQPRGAEQLKDLDAQDSPEEPQLKIPSEVVEEEGKDEEAADHQPRVGDEWRDPWRVWQSWVKQDHFYPSDAFWSKDMDSILHAMATNPITSFDVGHRGTQLKVSMFLGEQRTAFKPMRYF